MTADGDSCGTLELNSKLFENRNSSKDNFTIYGSHENNERTGDGDNKIPENRQSNCQRFFSCRWKLAYLCFFVRFITGAFRQSMSIAILSMVDEKNVSLTSHNETHFVSITKMEREFDWSTSFQGLVLTTFNGGAIIAPLLLGCLTRKASERIIILICLFVGAVSSFLLPPLIKANYYTIFLTRGVMGLSLAGTDIVIQSLWSFWAPEKERASLSSFAYAGISVSGMLTYPICGLFISLGDEGNGWPNIYYAFGTCTVLLMPFWWFNAYDSPKKHPRIADEELAFITDDLIQYDKETNDKLPWKSFFKSSALWAIFVCALGNKLVFSILLSFLPYYFHNHLHASVEESSLLSALPHIGRFVSGILGGYLSDWMLTKSVSIVLTRKTFQSVACFGCAASAIALMFTDHKNRVLAIAFLVVSVSLQNFASVAYRINLLDIAPRYAGFLSGLIGTVTNILSLPGPIVTSQFLEASRTSGWEYVFLTVAGVNITAGLVFLLFAAGDVQSWAHPTIDPKSKSEDVDR